MAVYLSLLENLKLGGPALADFARMEAARARIKALNEHVSRIEETAPLDREEPHFPEPRRGKAVALRFVCDHFPRLRPDLPLLHRLWAVAHEGPEPAHLDLEPLREVVDWASWELEYSRHPAILVIGTALAELLRLAPFPRGNIRLAKLWGTLMMLRAGFEYVPLAPIDEFVERGAPRLRACRERLGREPGAASLELWFEALLGCLGEQATAAMERAASRLEDPPLPELQERLLGLARQEGRLTSRRAQEVTRASRNTLKDNFRRLVEAGLLLRHGKRRGAFYTLARGPSVKEA